MGLCSNFALSLYREVLNGESCHPIEDVDSSLILQETSVLFLDLTQLFFFPSDLPFEQRTIEYESLRVFLESSDPIGEVFVDEYSGVVRNTLDVFSAEMAGSLLARRVENIEKKWRLACDIKGLSPSLTTMFLAVDGDSPVAKTTTRKRRNCNSKVSSIMKKLKSMLVKEESGIVDETKKRFFLWTNIGDGQLMGSLQRFMFHRENRQVITNSMSTNLKKNPHMHTTIYVASGRQDFTPRDPGLPQIYRVCGDFVHPNYTLPEDVPYYEADGIIPFLWSHLRGQEKLGCILSRDSDMLLSLLAMADPKLNLLYRMCGEVGQKEEVFDRHVAFCVKSQLANDVRTHMSLLLHLTMGGCDYAESFARCGVKTLLRGTNQLFHKLNDDVFDCVKFARWCDIFDDRKNTDMIVFSHESLSQECSTLRALILNNEKMFPVRLGNLVYVIYLDKCSLKQTVSWYKTQCGAKSKAVVTSAQLESFARAMNRRMFFLSFATECRIGLEMEMQWHPSLAIKCGYDYAKDFQYLY